MTGAPRTWSWPTGLHQRGAPLVAAIRTWAAQNPRERDHDASMVTAKRNALQILKTYADPAVGLFWTLFTRDDGNMWPAEDAYRDLLARRELRTR